MSSTLSVYTTMQNNLAGLVQDEKNLLVGLTQDGVDAAHLSDLEAIISATEQVKGQVDSLVEHYSDAPGELPQVHSIEPADGTLLGGTPVKIDGHHFTHVTKLFFGTLPCLDFSVVDDDTIDATSPKVLSGAPLGVYDITVVSPAGTSDIADPEYMGGFTYFDPTGTEKEDTSFMDGLKAGVGR